MSRPCVAIAAAGALTLLACVYTGESSIGRTTGPSTSDTSSVATSITALEGGAQTAPVGTALPDPLVVRVQNSGGGNVSGAVVTWTVTGGGGSLASDTSVSNTQGRATNTLTLGDSLGTQTVVAALRSDTTVRATFTVSAAPIPFNASVTVRDTVFAPDDVTIQSGGGVTWTWGGTLAHNLTWVSGGFPNADDRATGTHQVSFPSAGTFAYYCSIHGTPTTGMRGIVRVVN